MSNTSSLPLLRSGRGTSLRCGDDGLVLRRGARETVIPLAAVAEVRADRRSVEVRLKAPAGAEPVVHRVDGVSEAAAAVFAPAVTRLLPSDGETADGAALVTVRDVEAEPPTFREVFRRRLKRYVWGSLLAIVAMCVVVSYAQHPVLIVPVVMTGGIGFFFAGGVLALAPDALRKWTLPRRGITVIADYAHQRQEPNLYLWGDQHGNTRAYFDTSRELRIEISYDPVDPGTVVRADGKGRVLESSLLLAAALVALLMLASFLALPFYEI
ncbi:hypothetical protein [Streptomyces tritici]|uniref:hypothetical protein n=1 Tax=Streptomyces tritici TaxID=2054410 RepID=UPI003AF0DC04